MKYYKEMNEFALHNKNDNYYINAVEGTYIVKWWWSVDNKWRHNHCPEEEEYDESTIGGWEELSEEDVFLRFI